MGSNDDLILPILEKIQDRLNQMDTRFDRRFEQIDRRFEQLDNRLGRMDARFDELDHRLDMTNMHVVAMEARLTTEIGGLRAAIRTIMPAQTTLEDRVTRCEREIASLQARNAP